MWRRWSVLATTAISVFGIQTAQAAETSNNSAETAEVTVTGEATGSLTSVSPEESAKQKTQIPGAFTVKTTDDMELGRASNFEDLLQRTPGVFLQSENGAEVSKISIRGSGITSEDEPLGVMFLLDGLNFNQGDGESVLGDFDIAALSNELLEINDAFGNDIGTRNVPRTNHQGIEASLEVELLREILVPKRPTLSGDRLSFDQSYTLNDFQFDQNPVYGDNRIAGVPIHVYEAQLLYQSPLGFYAGPNLQCNLSRYPVDEANTLFADSYVLLGFRAGFRRTNGFSVFIDCRNLTDQRYASSIDVIADARTEPNPEIFHPGDGRSFYGGVSWSW
jgi:outer membrane receptor protein involved in Fe transport